MTQTSQIKPDYGKQNALAQLVCYKVDELLDKLEVDLRRCGKLYSGCCPVHYGDNYSALSLYPEGHTLPGYWRCRTHFCHNVFKPTIIGFVRGIFSRKYYNWSLDNNTKQTQAPFNKVLNWLCKFVGLEWNDIHIDAEVVEAHQFATQISTFKKLSESNSNLTRDNIRSHLEIPAGYYLNRQPPYQPSTLDYFDVGLCNHKGKEMYNRVVVPFYDQNSKYMLGCTARSIYNKCQQCNLYHHSQDECPNRSSADKFSKWRHSGKPGGTLYNWWNAKQSVRETNKIILVEGPGDVWRLWEAGVQNVVGMFGADLTDEQQILIEKSGAMKVYVICDNDDTGIMSQEKLKEDLSFYRPKFIVPSSAKDVGEMTVDQIKQEILPCLEK